MEKQTRQMMDSWRFGDGGGNPHPTKNDYKGTFSTPALEAAFIALTDTIYDGQFQHESLLTGISLRTVEKIGDNAFDGCRLDHVGLFKTYEIGHDVFHNNVNEGWVNFYIGKIFNSVDEKNRIFSLESDYNKIPFVWLDNVYPNNSLAWNGHVQTVQFDLNGKTVTKISWQGKDCIFKDTDIGYLACPIGGFGNRYSGTFSTPEKQTAFCSINDFVADNAFGVENVDTGLTEISIPHVQMIGRAAFKFEPLTRLNIPQCRRVGWEAFYSAKLGVLDLPECTNVDFYGFTNSPISKLNAPKLELIGRESFYNAYLGGTLDLPAATHIWPEAFYHSRTTSLNAPNLQIVEDSAFYSANIETLNAPKLITIGNDAFYNSEMTSLNLPVATKIGDKAFFHAKITTLNAPNVTSIGDFAFPASTITSLNLPSCRSIGNTAFLKCPLTRLNIPNATTIESGAFLGIENETTTIVTMPRKFNTLSELERIFGPNKQYLPGHNFGGFALITFHWV